MFKKDLSDEIYELGGKIILYYNCNGEELEFQGECSIIKSI